MIKYLIVALAWVAGSYLCYALLGTGSILPYAGVTIAFAALAVWLANRKPASLNDKAGQQ